MNFFQTAFQDLKIKDKYPDNDCPVFTKSGWICFLDFDHGCKNRKGSSEIKCNLKNAIGYIRISTADQSVYSLDYQESAVRRYCADNKLDLLELFKDNGESSYTFDRPDWKELEKFIRKNKSVQYLIIYNHDRFSRNLAEALMKIKELQVKFGVKVLATTDRLDIDLSDPSTYIMRAFSYIMAEGELMRIRERTKAGIMQAAMAGYHPNLAPYGYKNTRTPDGKPMLIEDKEKSRFVKEIFRLKLLGYSPEEIRAEIVPLGFKRKGKSAIQYILSNPIYGGFIRVPAYKDRPEYLTKGKHKGLVSEEEYWKAQGEPKKNAIQKKDDVPLRGVLKCWCGRHVTAGNSKGKNKYYWYYLCSEHKQNMSAVKLHKQLNEILEKISFSPEDIAIYQDRFMNNIASSMQARADEIGAARSNLEAIKKKIRTTEERYLSNTDIDPDTFKKVLGELKIEKSRIEKNISLLSATTENYMAMLEYLMGKLSDLKRAYDVMDTHNKQRFIKAFFGENLNWVDGAYRTPFLHPDIEAKAALLKENGLLYKEQPVVNFLEKSRSSEDGLSIEPFLGIIKLLSEIKTA